MAPKQKRESGYIKTENTILLIIMALAIGFIGGVVFSAYRYSGAAAPMAGTSAPQPGISKAQQEQLERLNAQVRNDPNDIDTWIQLGHLYFDTGQNDNAVEAYEHVVALDDKRPDIWVDLGVMYRRSGKPDKAIESFNKALKLNPTHEIALYNSGIVMMHDLKNMKGATEAWSRLLEINPAAKTPAGEPLGKMVEQLKRSLEAEKK